jgi:hypothetical protein
MQLTGKALHRTRELVATSGTTVPNTVPIFVAGGKPAADVRKCCPDWAPHLQKFPHTSTFINMSRVATDAQQYTVRLCPAPCGGHAAHGSIDHISTLTGLYPQPGVASLTPLLLN